MKDAIIIELARRWEAEANQPEDELPKEINLSHSRGYRECKRECADVLKMLVDILGEDRTFSSVGRATGS